MGNVGTKVSGMLPVTLEFCAVFLPIVLFKKEGTASERQSSSSCQFS